MKSSISRSTVTAQGQISVPAEVRRKLGIGPGSVLAWEEKSGEIVVRRVGRYSSADVHRALFEGKAPAAKKPADVKQGITRYMRKRHARD